MYAAKSVDRTQYVVDSSQVEFDFGDNDIPKIPSNEEGIRFTSRGGRIEIDDRSNIASISNIALHEQLLCAVSDFMSKTEGSNSLVSVRNIVHLYQSVISNQHIQIDTMYALGLRLGICLTKLQDEIDGGTLPDIDIAVIEPLLAISTIHGIAVMSTARGRYLADLARQYNEDNDDDSFRLAASNLSTAVKSSTEIFSEKVGKLISELSNIYGYGEHPGRTRQASNSLNLNLLVAVSSLAVNTLGIALANGTEISEILSGTPNVAWNLSEKSLSFIWRNQEALKLFVAASAEDFGWIERLLRWIKVRVDELASLRDA